MGESATETVKEIKQTRERLASNLERLEQRLPAPAVWAKRVAGVAVGGGVGGVALWMLVHRIRGRKADTNEDPSARTVIELTPRLGEPPDAEDLKRWKRYVAVGAGVWLAVRLLELRRARRLHRVLAGGA